MLTVSNYHYIKPNFNSKFPSIFGVTPDDFSNQLKLLMNKSEFVSSVDLLLNFDYILSSKTNYFFITFDDGLKEQYQYALPILDKLNIPAILFANSRNYEDRKVSTVHKIHLLRSVISPSEFLKNISNQFSIVFSEDDKTKAKGIYIYDDSESALLKYILNFKIHFNLQEEIIMNIFNNFFDENEVLQQLYMSELEIKHLGKLNFLGSHTHNHLPIGLLTDDKINFELEKSKKYFENLTKTKIEMVSYPYGNPESCTTKVATIAESVGYKLGFTTIRGSNDFENNPLLLNRYDCNDLIGGKNYKEV